MMTSAAIIAYGRNRAGDGSAAAARRLGESSHHSGATFRSSCPIASPLGGRYFVGHSDDHAYTFHTEKI
jgi:hypothetical protein